MFADDAVICSGRWRYAQEREKNESQQKKTQNVNTSVNERERCNSEDSRSKDTGRLPYMRLS